MSERMTKSINSHRVVIRTGSSNKNGPNNSVCFDGKCEMCFISWFGFKKNISLSSYDNFISHQLSLNALFWNTH
jgi:hypothetical protein